jgi:hypothetical protein
MAPSVSQLDSLSKSNLSPVTPPTPDLSAKVAELEARLASLEKVLKVGPAGDVTLKSSTTMSIEATITMTLKSGTIMLN